MSQVTKAVNYTATTDANGVCIVRGDIPTGWTDFTGAVASIAQNAATVKAFQTGANEVTYTFNHKKADGTLEPAANTQVNWVVLLCGIQ